MSVSRFSQKLTGMVIMGNRVGQVQWTILFNKCLLENIKYVINAAVMNRVNKVSLQRPFLVLSSRQLLSPILRWPRGPLGVRHTKSTVSTFRNSQWHSYINFVSADYYYFFFDIARKWRSTRSLLLPEDPFYKVPAWSIHSQSVGLFHTQTNKICFIC